MRCVVSAVCLIWLLGCAPEGPSAFVTFNVAPEGDCTYSNDLDNMFFPIGSYDLSTGDAGNCERPYVVNLLANSFLRPNSDSDLGRAEPNVLQIHSAKVKLMSISRETLTFPDTDPALPNPFLVATNNALFPASGMTPSTGIAAVEVIPVAYAEQLTSLEGQQILADIQVLGTTTGDVDVEFKPFVYPIELCDGCLVRCASIFGDAKKEDVYGEDCADDAGADGRICVDRGC